MCKNIGSAKGAQIHPEMVPVGPYGIDDEANGHTDKDIHAIFVKIMLWGKQKVYDGYGDIKEPQKIRNDKYLTKGDIVIQFCINCIKMRGYSMLQFKKPDEVYKKV